MKRRQKNIVGFLGILLFLLIPKAWADYPQVELKPTDRILILAPHPDDEVLGCGGIIQKSLLLKLPIRIVFLTNGDNNQWSFLLYRKHPVIIPGAVEKMGIVRYSEALAASKVLGLDEMHLTFLGYPDFGTMNIWYAHWNDRPPLRSLLTRDKAVPYSHALRPGAPYKGEDILQDLTQIIQEFQPTKIFVSHPADHNGDHLAFYLFTRVALWDLKMDPAVEVYPYLIHHKGWPAKYGYLPKEVLSPPASYEQEIKWFKSPLDDSEVEKKNLALKEHKSQYQSSAKYLLSFVRSNELFGDFPVINLSANFPRRDMSQGAKNSKEMPEELTDIERSVFVGVEWRYVRTEGKDLVLSFDLSRPLGRQVEASIYVFGYRNDRPFKEMPKLHIMIGIIHYKVYDQTTKLSPRSIQISRQRKTVTVRIPFELLGNPQKILSSARTYLGNVPLDWVSWRIIELSE